MLSFGHGMAASSRRTAGTCASQTGDRCKHNNIPLCLSNAPLDTPLRRLAQVQAQRFFIEHSFHEAKSERGMTNYQVRRWGAWHHHMALVMLAALLLIKQKLLRPSQWPMLSINDLVTALAHMLPRGSLQLRN